MSAATTKLMTADEFFDWTNLPDNREKHFELEKGRIIEMSRPGQRHGIICGNIAGICFNYVRKRKKGNVCSNDAGIIFERDPDTVRGPDIVLFDPIEGYENANPKYTDMLPVLAIEVLSPNDRFSKLTRRINQFLEWGIPLIWIVDPESKDVTVYRADKKPYVVGETEELTGDEILPDFRCNVADFFFVS